MDRRGDLRRIEGALAEAREVPDSVFLTAAKTLAGCVSNDRLSAGAIYPDQSELRDVSRAIACAVIRDIQRQDLGSHIPDDEIEEVVAEAMWYPDYEDYTKI